MYSLRRWLYRPKRSDSSLLAQFYFADEELNLVAAELDSFEGRKDPERCTAMVNQLRACQARVLNVVSQMMDETVKEQRAPRDFRVKFPDDVIQENLAGQLWFGAECLAAGSSIMNREVESACMRPLARALTKNLDSLRTILREQCLQSVHDYTETIKESLIIFDKLFAEFELSYVSAMVPVKTAHEYDMIQEITVLFSETVQRALKVGLLTVDMIDEYDPALMFTIPRLAIVCGVLIFKDGPLNPDNDPWNISEMFRPFQTLLLKIRELLSILTEAELMTLERALCSQEEPSFLISLEEKKKAAKRERRKSKEEKKKKKEKKLESEGDDGSVESELTALEIAERLEALALNFEASRNANNAPSDQVEPDSQSKDSEASSGSSLSEGGTETRPTEPDSNLSEDSQVQRFTNQLYYEANLDSQSIHDDALIRPLNAFSTDPEFISNIPPLQTPPNSSSSSPPPASNVDVVSPASEKTENPGDLDGEEESVGEDSSNRDMTSSPMVKCNSNDSGLHSDVVSNSGSMFTISSSDSNHLMTSPDTPTLPESFSRIQEFQYTSGSSAGLQENSAAGEAQDQERSAQSNLVETTKDADVCEKSKVGCGERPEAHHSVQKSQSDDTGSSEDTSVLHRENNNVEKGNQVPESAMSVCGSSNSDTQNDKNQSIPADAVSISQTTPVIPTNPSNNMHSPDHDSRVSPPTNDSELCSGSVEGSVQEPDKPLQEDAIQTHMTTCSNDITTQSEVDVREDSEQLGSSGTRDKELPTESQEESNASLTHGCSPCAMANTGATSTTGSTHPPHVSTSTAGSEPSRQETEPNSAAVSEPGVSQASGTASTGAKTSPPANKDVSAPSRSKGKLKRSSGVKGKRSSVPSRAKALMDDQLLDGECCNSSETSSYTSDCGDQEEIALAVEAVESATRQQIRARFRSSSDMIHRLFVCISGVADQLQTNFAGDLRNILRSVFDMNCSEPIDIMDGDKCKDTTPLGAAYIAISNASRNARRNRSATSQSQAPPTWVPDEQSPECMSCQVPFSFVRRRHHCRNCGKIFCSRCSSNFVPLPHFGEDKCVRVCNRCFMFRVTPFTVRSATN